jgi:DNA-binding CsgD family transcriptional regulator/PAS domain-containing protein
MIEQAFVHAHTGRSAQTLSAVLHLIYSAATDPGQWPAVLEAVASSLKGRSGVFFTPFLPPHVNGIYHAHNITPEQSVLWGTKYLHLDMWTQRAFERGLVKQGAVITDADTATEEEFLASEIYQGLFSTMDVGRFCSGVIFHDTADGIPTTVVTTHRSLSSPAFSQQDRAWLTLLLPHLSRALGLMYRIDSARLQSESLLAGLNALPLGVMLLNSQGQVMHANNAMRRVLARDDGLSYDAAGQLCAKPLKAGQPVLSAWLAAQTSLLTEDVTHFANAFLVRRKCNKRVYSLQCCPVKPGQEWLVQGQRTGAVVFVSDPQALVLPEPSRLSALYGLTPAQAKVASALAMGNSSKEVGKTLAISPETVRKQTQHVYQKMRVNSQSDLVRSILTLGHASV